MCRVGGIGSKFTIAGKSRAPGDAFDGQTIGEGNLALINRGCALDGRGEAGDDDFGDGFGGGYIRIAAGDGDLIAAGAGAVTRDNIYISTRLYPFAYYLNVVGVKCMP